MLVLKLKPSEGLGARPTEDPRGPGDSVLVTVPPRTEPVKILVTLCSLQGLAANVGFTAPTFVDIQREGR